ncbi:MAG: TldD/PmbA family protein [Candidatus Hermodarchaeota archaeon]
MESNKEVLIEKANMILKEAEKLGTSQAEVSITLDNSALTRLANNIIDQNVAEKQVNTLIIVYFGKRKGSVAADLFSVKSLKRAVTKAAKIANISPENSDFDSLPQPQPYSSKISPSELVSKETLNVTPEQRAEFAQLAINCAIEVDKRIKTVSGAISNLTQEKLIKNSLGVEAYDVRTLSYIILTILGNDGEEETAGWSADYRRDFSKLKIFEVARRAAQKAIDGFGAKLIKPGEYEVVLDPAATGGLIRMMSYTGFSALRYQEYTSFLRDKIGEKLFSEKLDFWSDPLDSRGLYASVFDGEGFPTKKLDLINRGVVKALAYDTLTASKDGVESTGHNIKHRRLLRLGMGESVPVANHLFVREGDSNIEEMISETKNGILVTHFHYQNPVNPSKGVFTGLTRDGTWLIEKGEIRPIKNLRYTDIVTRYFGNIDLIGKYQELQDGYEWFFQGMYPPMKLPSFRFTGSTKE